MAHSKSLLAAGVALPMALSSLALFQLWRNHEQTAVHAHEQAKQDARVAGEKAKQAELAARVALAVQQAAAVHAEWLASTEARKRWLADFKGGMGRVIGFLDEADQLKRNLRERPVSLGLVRLSPEAIAKLPAKFEDVLVYPAVEKDYEWAGGGGKRHHSYAGLRAPFTMVLVPGDPAKDIAPFYIGETEVSWELFREWSHWYDAPPIECQKEVEAGLRPSNWDSYSDTSHNDRQYEGYPALGMSRKTAEAFCVMLSKRTGRHYRLPTEAEWDRAYALGGGDPVTDEAKKKIAWCKENAEKTPESRQPAPGMCQAKFPNKLGLHDMLGNVAEWVQTPGVADADGKNTFVRGGDFKTPLAQLSGARREESDNRSYEASEESWNATYPQMPASRWWYKDHYQVGFRLACDPVDLPVAKP